MPLPAPPPLRRTTVESGGQTFEIRSLSRAQVIELNNVTDEHQGEVLLIAGAFEIDQDAAAAFLAAADPLVTDDVLEAILEHSGILELRRRQKAAAMAATAAAVAEAASPDGPKG